jgi:hypothetical protein
MIAATAQFDAILLQLKQSLPRLDDPLKTEATRVFNEIEAIITTDRDMRSGIDGMLRRIFNLRVQALQRLLIDGDLMRMLEDVAPRFEELRTRPGLEVLVESILFALQCNRRVLEALMERGMAITSPRAQPPDITYEEFLDLIELSVGGNVARRIKTFTNASLYIEFVLFAASLIQEEEVNLPANVIDGLAALVAEAAQEYWTMAIELELVQVGSSGSNASQSDVRMHPHSRSEAILALDKTYSDSCEEGWDGYNAAPSSVDALDVARRVLFALPETIPNPEIDVAPNGDILFEWRRAPRCIVVMSIAANGELSYAALFESTRRSGTDLFSDVIPRDILDQLYRLYP